MKTAALFVLAFSILSLSCFNQVRQQPFIDRNEESALGLLFMSRAEGNGVLFDINGEKYILTVSHFCDMKTLMEDVDMKSEEGKEEIKDYTNLVASKTFCTAVFNLPSKSNLGLAEVVAIDFEKDLMLMKVSSDLNLNTFFSHSLNTLRESILGEDIYAIVLFENISDDLLVFFSKAAGVVNIKSKKILGPRLAAHFTATGGFSGSSIYSIDDGRLLGVLSAELLYGNDQMPQRGTFIVEAKSIRSFIKEYLFSKEKDFCRGSKFKCASAYGDVKGVREGAKEEVAAKIKAREEKKKLKEQKEKDKKELEKKEKIK